MFIQNLPVALSVSTQHLSYCTLPISWNPKARLLGVYVSVILFSEGWKESAANFNFSLYATSRWPKAPTRIHHPTRTLSSSPINYLSQRPGCETLLSLQPSGEAYPTIASIASLRKSQQSIKYPLFVPSFALLSFVADCDHIHSSHHPNPAHALKSARLKAATINASDR